MIRAVKPAGLWSPNMPGAFAGLSHKQYLDSPGLSHSMLKNLRPTPAHFQQYLKDQAERADDPKEQMHFVIGTVIHQMVLQPDLTPPRIVVKPADMTYRTAGGKLWRDEHLAKGDIIFTQAEFDFFTAALRKAALHPLVQSILSEGESEVSVFHRLENGVLAKARLDFIPKPETRSLVDVKTCVDASPEAFQKSIADYRYHSQAAWYLDIWNAAAGWPVEHFVFIVIEKTPPYEIGIYQLHPRAIEDGRRLNREDVATYCVCEDSGEWPGYRYDPLPLIDLPDWYYSKEAKRQRARENPGQ